MSMSFDNYFNKLVSKPDSYKKKYAFWVSLGVTVIIFTFWITSFDAKTFMNRPVLSESTTKTQTPAESLVAGVGTLFSDIKDLILTPKKIKYGELQVSPTLPKD